MDNTSGIDSPLCEEGTLEDQDVNGDNRGTQGVGAVEEIWKVNSFRVALPQVLATLAQSLLLLALGMMIAMPTIVIAALHNSKTAMSMNDTEASWFAGIILACQPLGSVLSGALCEAFGRKRCMMTVALPCLAGWLLVYFSPNLVMLYLAAFCMGFSIGFMEAPCISYVGEITQPSLRARMCTLGSLNIPIGYLIMYVLGTVMEWRSTALCSTLVPVIIVLAISQVPESPHWLLRKGRTAEAEASLCWLRGWVRPEDVRKELSSMKTYCENSKLQVNTRSPRRGQIYIEVPRNGNGPRLEQPQPPKATLTLCEKLKDLTRPEMMRPLRLVLLYFFFYHCGGLTGLRPYMVNVFKELRLTIDPYWLTVASASMQILGAVCCMFLIHRMGKRCLSLVSMSACVLSLLALGTYSLLAKNGYYQPIIPVALFGSLFFSTNIGIAAVPWALLSEVFPPRGRGIGGGVASALYYIMYFVASKTFLDLQGLLGLHGVFLMYGSLAFVGLVYIYCCLPETEGRKLEEIEKFFQSKNTHSVPIN